MKDTAMRFRLSILAAAVLTVLTADAAGAQNYPWCAQYSGRGTGGRNCGFMSWQQCMATVSGVGGYCEQNAMYQPGSGPARKARRHRR